MILAGVALSLVVGENGITNRAITAAKTQDIAGAKEKLELLAASYAGDFYEAKYVTGDKNATSLGDYVASQFTAGTFEEDFTLAKDAKNSRKITISSKNYADNSATCTISDDGQVVWEGAVPVGNVWTQNKTKVSNGTIELDVGTKVTGYSVEGHTDLEWYVLGAKNGKLLITTNICPEQVELDGMENAISTLNSRSEKYTNLEYSEEKARTIDIDDINRVTSYNPETATCSSGELCELRNKVTFSWDGTDYPAYSASNELTGNLEENHSSGFSYYNIDTKEWVTETKANSGEITTLTSTLYCYYPKTLTTSDSGPQNGIPTDGSAYALLFSISRNEDGDDESAYWLGSPYVEPEDNKVYFGLRCVRWGLPNCDSILGCSTDRHYSDTMGLRPVDSKKLWYS